MKLTVDIGNSLVHAVLFRGRRIVQRAIIPTARVTHKTESLRMLRPFLSPSGIAIASVVPKLDHLLGRVCRDLWKVTPALLSPRDIPLDIGTYPADRIGIDRVLAAYEAFSRTKSAVIVIDAGTGMTIDAVSSAGKFLGGAILPGPELWMKALHAHTARLPLLRPERPRRIPGRTTAACIHAGVYFGMGGAADRIVEEISASMKTPPALILTGGFAPLLKQGMHRKGTIVADLVCRGIWRTLENGTVTDLNK